MTGDDQHVLTTRRFRLRPVAAPDLPALLTLCEDPGVRRFLVGPITGPGLRDALAAGIAASSESFVVHGIGVWGVTPLAAPAGVPPDGVVGFVETYTPPELQLVYGLASALRGGGAAGECAAAVLRHAFTAARPPLARAVASVEPENLASARVLARLGFRRAGENREWRADLGGRWVVLDRHDVTPEAFAAAGADGRR